MVQLLGAAVADAAVGVGEPDAARTVHHQVVGVIVPLAVQRMGQGSDALAVLFKPDDAPPALLAAEEVARGVEAEAVDVVDPGEIPRWFRPCTGVIPQQAALGDMGEYDGLAVPDRPFGGAAKGSCYQFKVPAHG